MQIMGRLPSHENLSCMVRGGEWRPNMDATTADNVHHLPTPVEKIGYALRDGHERMQRGEQEWIEGALMVADALYAGREEFKSDNDFGRWLKLAGYNFYKKND